MYPGGVTEIGWFPVLSQKPGHPLTEQLLNGLDVLHWHGDTFDLPQCAELLYSSELYPNQAFVSQGRYLGLQFHLELGPADAERLCLHAAQDLKLEAYIQTAEQILSNKEGFATTEVALMGLLDRFFAEILAGSIS